MTKRLSRGFTLIELMIVVAIIGILAAIAVPKFADLVRKSKEGATKGNLGAIRSALLIYYGDMEGSYPTDDLNSLTPKYITDIPNAKVAPHHGDTNSVIPLNPIMTFLLNADNGGWRYYNWFGMQGSSFDGVVYVNCLHTDSKGTMWVFNY